MARSDDDEATLVAVDADVAQLSRSRSASSSSGGCSTIRSIRTTASSTSRPEPAAPRRRTGRRCSSACTCATASAQVQDRGARRVRAAKSPASRARRSRWSAITRSASCAPKPASTAWCASRRSIRTRAATRRSRACSCIPEVDETIEVEINPADLRDRHLPRFRRRRPARQQDRLGGAHHAPADQHRRAVPERPLPAPQPRRSDGDAEVEAVRAGAAQAAGAADARGLEDRHRLGPPDPLVRARPVAHQGPAHQLSRSATRRRCSTAISTTSSQPA